LTFVIEDSNIVCAVKKSITCESW